MQAPIIAVVGGGIAGLSCGIALQNAGYEVKIFEAAPAIKPLGAGLSLAANAIKALEYLGLKNQVVAAGHALPYFNIYNQQGKTLTTTNSGKLSAQFGIDNFLIHRFELHEILLNKVGQENCITNKRIISLIQQQDQICINFADGSHFNCNYLIAADGIHSAIRQQLLPQAHIRHAGYACWRAVINSEQLKINETFETWGNEGCRFGVSQLAKNKIYWYACINASQNSKLKNYTITDLQNRFKNFHHPIPDVLAQTQNHQLIWNDISDLKPLKQFAFNNILLVGDAAHATTPNMGQGACQALEDAATLQLCLLQQKNIADVFKIFEQKRIPRTKFVIKNSRRMGQLAQSENKFTIALRNFIMPSIPNFIKELQFKKLYNIKFD